MKQLGALLKEVPQDDNVWLCMDANGRLQSNNPPFTSRFGVHKRGDEGGDLVLELMQEHELQAINTYKQHLQRNT